MVSAPSTFVLSYLAIGALTKNKAGYTAKNAFSLVLPVDLVKNGDFAWFQLVCDRQTDGPTDGRTDGRTHPLIAMRERI